MEYRKNAEMQQKLKPTRLIFYRGALEKYCRYQTNVHQVDNYRRCFGRRISASPWTRFVFCISNCSGIELSSTELPEIKSLLQAGIIMSIPSHRSVFRSLRGPRFKPENYFNYCWKATSYSVSLPPRYVLRFPLTFYSSDSFLNGPRMAIRSRGTVRLGRWSTPISVIQQTLIITFWAMVGYSERADPRIIMWDLYLIFRASSLDTNISLDI